MFVILIILLLAEVINIYLKCQFIVFNTRRALEFSVTSLLSDHYTYVFNSAKASWATSVDENQRPILLSQDLGSELRLRLPLDRNLVSWYRDRMRFAIINPQVTYDNRRHLKMKGQITLVIPVYFYGKEVNRLRVNLTAYGEYQLKGIESYQK